MKENVEYLQRLGLTEYQSKTLIVLLAKGESKARDVSNFGGIPLTKLYQVLKGLEYLGLVKCTIGKPKLYKSLTPGGVLNKLIKKQKTLVVNLEKMKSQQMKMIRGLELRVEERPKVVHPCMAASQYYR